MRMHPARIVSNTIAMILLLLLCAGCAQRMQSVIETETGPQTNIATLHGVKVADDASRVEISADKPLIYAYYKSIAPPKAVIDLAQTVPGTATTPVEVNKGNIKAIDITRHGAGDSMLSRVQITLEKDEEFTVMSDPADNRKLIVAFTKPTADQKAAKVEGKVEEKHVSVEDVPVTPAPVTVAAAKAPAVSDEISSTELKAQPHTAASPGGEAGNAVAGAKAPPVQKGAVLNAITTGKDSINVSVAGGVPAFHAFKLTGPPRLVVDLFGVKNGLNAKTIAVDRFGFGNARIGISPDKVRIVLDTTSKYLPPYRVIKNDNGVMISLKAADAIWLHRLNQLPLQLPPLLLRR